MRQLKMSWNTEHGHLVCRWIEVIEREKRSCNPGNQSMAVHVAELSSSTGFAVLRHFHRRPWLGDALGER